MKSIASFISSRPSFGEASAFVLGSISTWGLLCGPIAAIPSPVTALFGLVLGGSLIFLIKK